MTKDELLDVTVSWVPRFTSKSVSHQSLRSALEAIRNGAQKHLIQRMRALVVTNKDQYDKIKDTL